MSDAAPPAEKKPSFEEYLAKVPDPPARSEPRPDPKDDGGDGEISKPPAADASKTNSSTASPAEPASKTNSTDSAAAADHRVDQIKAALRAGDLDALADLIDEDPASYDEKTPKWAAQKRKEAKLRQERDSVLAKAEAVVTRYAPVDELVARVRSGDHAALKPLVELLTEEDFDSATMKTFRAIRGEDPRVPALTSRAAKAEAERDAALATRAEKALADSIRDEVDAKDAVRKLSDWEAKVAKVLKDSYDPDLGEPGLSVKQAAKRVVREEREAYERLHAAFGGGAPAPAAKKETAPERAAGASGVGKKKLSREEWLAARGNG